MRQYIYTVAFVASAILAGPAMAQGAQTVFTCTLRNGKTVRIADRAGTFTYTYGNRGRAEMTLTGNANSGNLHFMQQRFAGPEFQIRFSNGATHYIVYAMEGSAQTRTAPVSGLVVMRGTRRISNQTCSRYSDFTAGLDDLFALPRDSEAYSAM